MKVTTLMHHRILIADLGFSSIPDVQALQERTWLEMEHVTDEQKVGIVMLTGVRSLFMKKHFPQFDYTQTTTLGSSMIIAWHPSIWKLSPEESGIDVLCGSRNHMPPNERTALVAHLHRVDAEADTGDASSLAAEKQILLILTKFHRCLLYTSDAADE